MGRGVFDAAYPFAKCGVADDRDEILDFGPEFLPQNSMEKNMQLNVGKEIAAMEQMVVGRRGWATPLASALP